ncbi:MAG: hypothetical protein GY918_01275 [Gammaproteobacteria bacterium]|nr:hypothetical protein [Gammaproteobacteria bacterium]
MSSELNAQAEKPLLPVNHLLQIPECGEPFLQGLKCSHCGHIATDQRIACPACFARNTLMPTPLSSLGKVLAFTVVRRSFPGLPVPFVSAVIHMKDGGDIKVNLENIDVDHQALQVGLEVELIFKQAPWGDEHGNEYMIYAAQPVDQALHTVKEDAS